MTDTPQSAGPVEERAPSGTLRSFVVRKHRDGPATYHIVIEEIVHEVEVQCAMRGWQRTGDVAIAFDPGLSMAVVNARVEEAA